MKTPLKVLRTVGLAALLFFSGLAVGWHLRGRVPVIPPVTAEITLDARNRPASLQQFVVMPDGQRLQHGKQFQWDWHDEPSGCTVRGLRIERREYEAGTMRSFAGWSDPSPTLEPGKQIDAAILTKDPDER